MALPALSAGILARIHSGETIRGPILQVIDVRSIQSTSPESSDKPERWRLIVSDGTYHQQAMVGTQLNLLARRSIYASAILGDQNYTATSVELNVQQRFTDKVSLFLSLGYLNSAYSAAAAGILANREDNYFYIRPGLQWSLLSWLNLGIFYEYSENISTGEGARGFARDRLGIQTAIAY